LGVCVCGCLFLFHSHTYVISTLIQPARQTSLCNMFVLRLVGSTCCFSHVRCCSSLETCGLGLTVSVRHAEFSLSLSLTHAHSLMKTSSIACVARSRSLLPLVAHVMPAISLTHFAPTYINIKCNLL